MNVFSISTRQKLFLIFLMVSFAYVAWLIQLIFIVKLKLSHSIANLPLTIVIVTGLMANKKRLKYPPGQIAKLSLRELIKSQFKNGSLVGLGLGAFMASLEKSLTGSFPVSYIFVGYLSGYFSLRNFNWPVILIIPLVFMFSILSECIYAIQLFQIPGVYNHLIRFAMVEASLNALIAPFVYYPINTLYEFWTGLE